LNASDLVVGAWRVRAGVVMPLMFVVTLVVRDDDDDDYSWCVCYSGTRLAVNAYSDTRFVRTCDDDPGIRCFIIALF
jgi:hypothetical protein